MVIIYIILDIGVVQGMHIFTHNTNLFDFYSKYGGFSKNSFLGTTCLEPNIWFSGFSRHPPQLGISTKPPCNLKHVNFHILP